MNDCMRVSAVGRAAPLLGLLTLGVVGMAASDARANNGSDEVSKVVQIGDLNLNSEQGRAVQGCLATGSCERGMSGFPRRCGGD